MSALRAAWVSAHGCPLAAPGAGSAGGMNVFLLSMAQALARAGVQTDIYTAAHGQCAQPLPAGSPLRLIHLDADDFAGGLLTAVEAAGVEYALVHSHYWESAEPGLRLAERIGAPHFFTGHTIAAIKEHAGGAAEPEARKAAESDAVRRSDAVVTFTNDESALLHALLGLAPHRVHAVPMGVDAALFAPQPRAAARRALGVGERERVALYVGRIEPYKGTDVLVRALSLLPKQGSVCLLVVGGSEGERSVDWLREEARASGVSGLVDWRGAVPQGALPAYYAAADVCVVPSLHETFGLVALEAMACGTPVVASDAGGLRELVRHGEDGLLCKPGDAAALAEALAVVLSDPLRAQRMGGAGASRAQRFTWDAAAARLAAVYIEVARASIRDN